MTSYSTGLEAREIPDGSAEHPPLHENPHLIGKWGFMLINSVLESIGNTPSIRLRRISSGNVLVKADFLNPGGSIEDRVAKHIIESVEKEGKLTFGMTIIEATS